MDCDSRMCNVLTDVGYHDQVKAFVVDTLLSYIVPGLFNYNSDGGIVSVWANH